MREIEEKVVVLCVNQTYDPKMTYEEKYEVSRGIWKASYDRLSRANYAFITYYGIIIGVYKIKYWELATRYNLRHQEWWKSMDGRYQFIGERDMGLESKYFGQEVSQYISYYNNFKENPVKFINA